MSGYDGLQRAVASLRYKDGWRFRLHQGATYGSGPAELSADGTAAGSSSSGWTIMTGPVSLVVTLLTPDSGSGQMLAFEHVFSVPPRDAGFEWDRWLLDRILDVERHEACEFFTVDGHKPFYPPHGPGAALYSIARREPAQC